MGSSTPALAATAAPDRAGVAPGDLVHRTRARGLTPLALGGRSLLPVVQGGMGVGISAHRLAGSVAALGAMGTISSVDLRRLYPDLMEKTRELAPGAAATAAAKRAIDEANLEALTREIRAARALAGDRGLLAINVMRAVSEYGHSVTRALECGIDAVVVGAGLPLDLPDLARDHPKALLVPILSDARGVQLVVRKWERKQRMPDAIVIEHPRLAGGHLGAAKVADLKDPRFDFENVIPQALAFLRAAGLEGQVPLIAAGGIRRFEDIARLQSLGAAAVQLGTAFVATEECDADDNFKRVLAEARDEDLVEFTSVAGLPARAVDTPWLRHYLAALPRLQETVHKKPRCILAFDCLAQCGLRDGFKDWFNWVFALSYTGLLSYYIVAFTFMDPATIRWVVYAGVIGALTGTVIAARTPNVLKPKVVVIAAGSNTAQYWVGGPGFDLGDRQPRGEDDEAMTHIWTLATADVPVVTPADGSAPIDAVGARDTGIALADALTLADADTLATGGGTLTVAEDAPLGGSSRRPHAASAAAAPSTTASDRRIAAPLPTALTDLRRPRSADSWP